MKNLFLGIDIGTSAIKSVVLDDKGTELAISRRIPSCIRKAMGASEIDMEGLWHSVAASIREVLAMPAVERTCIRGCGISGTTCGLWPIDQNGAPLRNAIFWNDGRAARTVSQWQNSGKMAEVFAISGNVLFPGVSLPLVHWFKHSEPELYERTDRFLFCKDWIKYRLTGEISTEHSDAGLAPYDIRAQEYSPALFASCGIEDALPRFPAICSSDQIAGHVSSYGSEQTGLARGTPVVAGMVDLAATTLGAGACRATQACSIAGTSFLNCFLLPSPVFLPQGVGIETPTVNQCIIRALVNSAGTLNIDWLIKLFFSGKPKEEALQNLDALIHKTPIGSGGLIYHPYLNTTGVFSPFFNSAARAQFFGLSIEHELRHMVRAVFEGVALAMKDCVEHTPGDISDWFIAGGGKNSEAWCQIFADATKQNIKVPAGEELGARGLVILTGKAVGIFASIEDGVKRMTSVVREYAPKRENSQVYDAIYPIYKDIYQKMDATWAKHQNCIREQELLL